MVQEQVKEIIFNERPNGMPEASTFQFNEKDMPTPASGEVLLKRFMCLLILI